MASAIDAIDTQSSVIEKYVTALGAVVPSWLSRYDEETIELAAGAALALMIFSKPQKRTQAFNTWAAAVRHKPTSRTSARGDGYFFTLAMSQPLAEKAVQGNDIVCEAFLERWREDPEIETRTAILQGLTRSRLLQDKPMVFLDILADGLNDYTTNARGDIGSHVRVQALRAVRSLWTSLDDIATEQTWLEMSVKKLFCSTMRLAAEKLDRVRPEAQAAIVLVMKER